jgi:hypothetical protein
MFARNPRRSHSPEPLFQRLDRAAATLNPLLAIIVIGLIILNVMRVFSLVMPLEIHLRQPECVDALVRHGPPAGADR